LAALVLMLTLVSSAAADQTYTDPQGDGKVGTDVATIVVKNDASGNILIDVTSVNPVVANHAIAIFIDADRNTSTGSSFGDDFWFYGGPAVGAAFFAWNGSQFAPTSPGSFSAGQVGTNTSEFRINKADLGNTSAFNFVAISISIDPPNVNFWDSAPDTGEFTYTLTTQTPPPAPQPKPSPPPSPSPAKPKSPDSLPTIFGPSKRSRKDPEYSRFATRLATFFHGGTRAVFCWNPPDWAALTGANKSTIALGFVEYRSAHQINLAPNVCNILDRLYYHHQSPPITPAIALSVVTFVHELAHTLGVTNEAAAQCYGIQLAPLATRLLGPGTTYGQRVAQLAWRLYNPRVLPAKYLSSECRNGGKLDLFPKSNVWP
jgi:hypothetical protein